MYYNASSQNQELMKTTVFEERKKSNPVSAIEERFIKKQQANEIRGLLSDLTICENTQERGVLKKIEGGRKERHEDAVEVMMQELAFISLELEAQIEDVCRSTKSYLDSNAEDIDIILEKIKNNENLLPLSLNNLKMLWNLIEKHSLKRGLRINQLSESLENIEISRAKLVIEVLQAYKQTFDCIAHIKPAEVHKFLEDKAMEINMSVICNHKSYAELIGRLLTVDVEREKSQKIFWESKVEVWKDMKLSKITEKHKEFMTSESITNSPTISCYLEKLINEQEALNARRLYLLEQLREITPPSSTQPSSTPQSSSKTAVYQWSNEIAIVTQNIDDVQSKYRLLIKAEQQNILCLCEEYIQKTKDELLKEGVVEELHIEELLNDIFYPLFGERKALFEYQLEKLECCMLDAAAKQKRTLSLLFEYVQGAAHIWDNHVTGMSEKESRLQELLDGNRRRHDKKNQSKELKLDDILDKMRQDSSTEMLASNLKHALDFLEVIKKGYYDFHEQQKKICEKFPQMLMKEINRYSSALCAFFGIPVNEANEYDFSADFFEISNKIKKDFLKEYDDAQNVQTNLSLQNISSKSVQAEECHFDVQPYIKSFHIPSVLFGELKFSIFTKFMEHLKVLQESAKERSCSYMNEKVVEINNELELRLHLHNPRPLHCKENVHDVRTAELVAHRTRIDEHIIGVTQSLALVKKKVQDVFYNPNKQRELFLSTTDELEEFLSSAAHINELNSYHNRCIERLNQVSKIVNESISQLRSECISILNKSRNGTNEFGLAMRLFSEGGNFSQEESVGFKKQLAKMVSKINFSETKMMKELDALELREVGFAKEFAEHLEERFSFHLFDVTFVENSKRFLRSIQLKINNEVAKCNSQGINLKEMILSFGQQIENVKKSHDLVDTDALLEKIYKALPSLILLIQERIDHLGYCTKAGDEFVNDSLENCQQTNKMFSKQKSSSQSPDGPKSLQLQKIKDNHHFESAICFQFTSQVTILLQTGLNELLLSAELYYRQKAQRPSTRQNGIKKTFESCAAFFILKLKNYQEQSEKFRMACIQELQSQVSSFMKYAQLLPELLVQSLYRCHQTEFWKKEEDIRILFSKTQDVNLKKRREYQTLLRPTLGHPNNELEMRKLCNFECLRQEECLKAINNYQQIMEDTIKQSVRCFVDRLQETVDLLLTQFDQVTVFEKVAATVKTKTEKELLKEKLMNSKKKESIKDCEFTWPAIDMDAEIMKHFYCDNVQTSVISLKNTSVHALIMKSRDKIFKKIHEEFAAKLLEIKETCRALRSDEEMWERDWNASVKKIKELY